VKQLYFALIIRQQGKKAAADTDSFIHDARKRIQRLLDLKSTNVQATDLHRLTAFEADVQQFKAKAESGSQVAYMALKRPLAACEPGFFSWTPRSSPKTRVPWGPGRVYNERHGSPARMSTNSKWDRRATIPG